MKEPLREKQRLQAQVRQLKKENYQYSIQLHEQKRKSISTDVGSALYPLTESTSKYTGQRPSRALSTRRSGHREDMNGRYHGRNLRLGMTSFEKNIRRELSTTLAKQILRNTAPRSRLTEHAI